MLALTTADNSIHLLSRILGTFSLWLGAGTLPFYIVGFATHASHGSPAVLDSSTGALWMLPTTGLSLAAIGLVLSCSRPRRAPVSLFLALALNLTALALCLWPR